MATTTSAPVTPTVNDRAVTALCDAVMRGFVVAMRHQVADLDRAIAIMRAEVRAFLLEARYADARACVVNHSLHQATVVALVVAECVAAYTGKAVR